MRSRGVGWLLSAVIVGVCVTLQPTSAARRPPDANYWIGFPANLTDPGCVQSLKIDVTGAKGTSVKVFWPDGTTDRVKLATTRRLIDVPASLQVVANDTVEDKGIRVKASANIGLVGHIRMTGDPSCDGFSSEAFRAIPTSRLGKDHYVAAYTPPVGFQSQVTVVGTVAGTTVTVTPSVTVGEHDAGEPFDVDIEAGETWALRSAGDLSGTRVTADERVAVFGSVDCAQVPIGTAFCDMLVEALPPMTRWGDRFVLSPFAHSVNPSSADRVRLVGSVTDTTLTYDPSPPAGAPLVLGTGDVVEFELSSPVGITASAPIMIAQYERSNNAEGGGDPFMAVVPPTSAFKASVSFTRCPDLSFQAATIIAPTNGLAKVKLDGASVDTGAFTAVGSTGFSVGSVEIDPPDDVRHKVAGPKPLMAISTNLGTAEGCGYPARVV